MQQEPTMSGQDSLRIITEMIAKARTGRFHESGSGAILWGATVGVAGLLTFADWYFKWQSGFDWWILALIALIPQAWLSWQAKKRTTVVSHEQRALDMVWAIFGISLFAIIAYSNIVPGVLQQQLAAEGITLYKHHRHQEVPTPFKPYVPSISSLLILIYGFPTMVTGIVLRFKPMIIGGAVCYLLFILSLFTNNTWDNLLNGLAGIFNWLIPGLILQRKYQRKRQAPAHV